MDRGKENVDPNIPVRGRGQEGRPPSGRPVFAERRVV